MKKEDARHAMDALFSYAIVLFGIAFAVTAIGTVLGAINFVSPVTYPALVLVIWVLGCLYVLLFLCAHLGVYMFLAYYYKPNDGGETAGGLIALILLIAIAGGIMIGTKHLGMFSGLAFIVILVMLCVDFMIDLKKEAGK